LLFAKNRARGIFTADPQKDPKARFYRRMRYNTILQKELAIVDQPSVILARDHRMPIHMFNFAERGTMLRICQGEDVGTVVADMGEDVLE
jgi:uridylate kinase